MRFVPESGAFLLRSLSHPPDFPVPSCCVEVGYEALCLSSCIGPGRMMEGNHRILLERACGVPGMLPVPHVVCPKLLASHACDGVAHEV